MRTKGIDIIKLILFVFAGAIVWGFLFSCKPIKETVIEYKTVTIHDTIKGKDGRDSIVYRDVQVEVPREVIKTRWQTRFETKRFNDSLKHVRKVYSDSLKYALKHEKIVVKYKYKYIKQEVKKVKHENNWKRIIPVILFLLAIIIYLLKKK